ncbi:MAG: ABC transporter ATP-binding protein [Nitrososphaerota archaeon]|jgi:energy-coupling factor transport system ATP-binding protein|nr:ABC transporter ATP-binding protein [Nitrososphaerota archaeon]MDG6964412.1 ABC transporter ATP-binding protein [Nitrososphaerota archaeon]MDG6974806.1 ABC transporter ATP-binding protein [Nitrososphaerota archaeon]MDG7010342.1 ABC transporter ATP-binding protein [Nitrososphaerota archaeon]MDG7019202.1 ABC transporter ATP-binding protein [Nitrososphaerota archaeon]
MIRFDDVTFVHQNGVRALDGVTLEVRAGETVAIVGENGAGKTTLVKHVTGLLKPASGRVLVDGADTKSSSTAQLSRKVGVAFQNPDHQLFSETVEEEMSFALKNFGFSPDLVANRVSWGLELFGLEEYRKSSPLVLSGGEKKRLTLACILAWDPQVVILDEPTVGQDSIQKEKLAGTIRMLRSTGKTVVVVSHDIEFLWPIQPRVVVMKGGKVVGDGPASEVMQDRELLESARVAQPQLVEFHHWLGRGPERPFVDPLEARRWVEGGMRP